MTSFSLLIRLKLVMGPNTLNQYLSFHADITFIVLLCSHTYKTKKTYKRGHMHLSKFSDKMQSVGPQVQLFLGMYYNSYTCQTIKLN